MNSKNIGWSSSVGESQQERSLMKLFMDIIFFVIKDPDGNGITIYSSHAME